MTGNTIAQIRQELTELRNKRQPKPSAAARYWVALFFVALLSVGLWAGLGYGRPWDEKIEQDILVMNINEYAMRLGLDTRYTIRTRPEDVGAIISQNSDRDHGVCAFYPVFMIATNNDITEHTRMVLWHSYIWLWFMAAVLALYFIAREMKFSRGLSCVAALLLYLLPRMFAQGHYNNKDILMLTFVLLMLLFTIRLMNKATAGRAIPFALFGAMATNVKIVGAYIYFLCAVFVLITLIARRQMNRRAWQAALMTVLGFFGFYLLLTPAAWYSIAEFVEYSLNNAVYYSRWDSGVTFQGRVYWPAQNDPLPNYYLPYLILTTMPLWFLALLVTGQIAAICAFVKYRRSLFKKNSAPLLLLCTVLWLSLLVFVVASRPLLYNGWRHFYFLTAPMLVLAVGGLKFLWSAAQKRASKWPSRILAGALAVILGATGVSLAVNHPYQYAYYNILLSGQDVPAYMELDYWNLSVYNVLLKLLDKVEGKFALNGTNYHTIVGISYVSPELTDEQRARMIGYLETDQEHTYYLVNPTYSNISGWKEEDYSVEVVVEAVSYGWPICRVYRNK